MKIDFFDESELLPTIDELNFLKEKTKEFYSQLKQQIKKRKIKADIFVGGSFAKGTLAKDEFYDIDIFVRFDDENDLSDKLERIVKEICNKKELIYKRVHGSRDYFQIPIKEKIIFEVIPVLKVKSIKYAKNVTDQSYFHVNYVKKKLNRKIAREIAIAKKFFKAQKIYGAESYVGGFSGYGIECLIIYFKSFEKMLRELTKTKGKIIIDPAKHYKRKEDIFIEINSAKLKGPVILVDPVWKERNVLAALSEETFSKFKETVRRFLKKPNKGFFEEKKNEMEKIKESARKNTAEFIDIFLKTDRQEGDIAGTKMKKFSNYLLKECEKYFSIIDSSFKYERGKESHFYVALKPRKEIIRKGPLSEMQKEAQIFKKMNKEVFEKNGRWYARLKIDFPAKIFLKEFIEKQKDRMNEMGIVEMGIV